jgi:hypothetical protein
LDVRSVTTADLDEWADFVADNPTATGLHAPGWRAVLSEAFAVKPLFLGARDEEGRLRGVLPLFRSRSLFFGDFISTLEDGHCAADDETALALSQGAIDLLAQEGCGCLMYRSNFAGGPRAGGSQHVETMKTVVSTNRPVDDLFASLDKDTRWGVRKAAREGYEVREANDRLSAFHRIYSASLHRLGTPAFGSTVFESMRRHLGTHLSFYAVERGDQLLGGMVCLKAAQEWTNLYVAVEPVSQRQYASYLLYWTVIEAAARCDVVRFNLGRSMAGSGVHHFKHNWTKNDVLTTNFLVGPTAPRLVKRLGAPTTQFGMARRLWGWLPRPVAQSAGSYLRRTLPFV